MAVKSVSALREQLQLLIGDGLSVTLENFGNVAGTQYRNAVIAVRPKTVNDVQMVLRSCLSLRIRVRAVAHAFSLGPLFPEEGQVALYTNMLERHDGPKIELLKNDRDPTLSELTVMCNVTMEELLQFQLENGFELPGNVINRFSTVGGCVAFMAHGSGLHVQTLSDLVVRIRIIDSSGGLRVYDLTDPELLNAAKGSLGLFGVIYDVTFRVSPLSVVQVENRWIAARHVFYERNFLAGLVNNNVSCQLFWWPFNSLSGAQKVKALFQKHVDETQWAAENDDVWVRTINRPAGVPGEISEEGLRFGTFWHGWSFKKNKWFSKNMPSTTPLSLHKHVAAMKSQFTGRTLQPVPHAVHFLADIDENPVWEMEFVFNHDPDCVNIQVAIMELIGLLKANGEIGNFPLRLPVEIGVTGASRSYLAPGYAGCKEIGGAGYAAYIKLATFINTDGWREFCTNLVQQWMKIPGILPSWGHQWSFLPEINNIISTHAKAGIAKFRELHQRAACDPGHLFLTERLEAIIFGTLTPPTVGGSNQNQVVYPSPNNQQVHGGGQTVLVNGSPQPVHIGPNGQVTVLQAPGQGQNLMHQNQLLSLNGMQDPNKKKKKNKFLDLFKRPDDGHGDGTIINGTHITHYNQPQTPHQNIVHVVGQQQKLVLLKTQDGKMIQAMPQQPATVQQIGVHPNQVIQQRQGVPQKQVIMLQAPTAGQKQNVSYVQTGTGSNGLAQPQNNPPFIIRR